MPDIQKVIRTKEKIIESIKTKGPSYPALISREVGLSPLFTAAFLSELVKERKLKLSNMKIGSSPIYYLKNQEHQLENFVDYLNHKEKESFFKLKESEILEDTTQEPAIRVALRKIKDFAIPITVKIGGETKLFWKYFQFPESETRDKIRKLLNPSKPSRTQITKPPQVQIAKPDEQPKKIEEKKETFEKEIKSDYQKEFQTKTLFESPLEEKNQKQKTQEIKTSQKPKKNPTSEFSESIKDYLAKKEIEIIDEISVKKKEFIAKIRLNTLFGKQEFYLISKEKKRINQNDLTIAIQIAQSEKMPALFISPGELDKNAKSYLQEWRNIIKFDKMNTTEDLENQQLSHAD